MYARTYTTGTFIFDDFVSHFSGIQSLRTFIETFCVYRVRFTVIVFFL